MEEKNKRLYMVSFNDFHQALEYNPQNADAERELGLVAIELHKYDQAILAFVKVEEMKKEDTTAIVILQLYTIKHINGIKQSPMQIKPGPCTQEKIGIMCSGKATMSRRITGMHFQISRRLQKKTAAMQKFPT
jgi:tetratricopeptide (TPR) repeat protein